MTHADGTVVARAVPLGAFGALAFACGRLPVAAPGSALNLIPTECPAVIAAVAVAPVTTAANEKSSPAPTADELEENNRAGPQVPHVRLLADAQNMDAKMAPCHNEAAPGTSIRK